MMFGQVPQGSCPGDAFLSVTRLYGCDRPGEEAEGAEGASGCYPLQRLCLVEKHGNADCFISCLGQTLCSTFLPAQWSL